MFKVGDMVWAKTHRYGMTSWHRPCEVINVNKLPLGKISVRIAKTVRSYEVDACEFEHISKELYFKKGDLVTYREMVFKFIEYDCMETAKLKHKEGYLISAEIKGIRKVGGFFV